MLLDSRGIQMKTQDVIDMVNDIIADFNKYPTPRNRLALMSAIREGSSLLENASLIMDDFKQLKKTLMTAEACLMVNGDNRLSP
jgi:hypothetical protein